MGKFRSKLKGQTKGKRWPKGQSSNSNPETRRYRDQAKSRFFQENLGASSGLTSTALKKHDAAVQAFAPSRTAATPAPADDVDASTAASTAYSSYKSFASDWTDCTSMSFSKFLNVFQPNSAIHKEMLAILAAVTEVIKMNGGAETPAEYYCALLTTLEQIYNADDKNEDQITAVLSLLNMGIKTVSDGVLRSSFNDVTQKMLHILNDYTNSDNNTIIKSLIGILCVLLKTQELAVWTHDSTGQIFKAILNPFCIHSKPKWRKAAQQAVAIIVKTGSFATETINPAAIKVAEFCREILDSCLGGDDTATSNTTLVVSSIQAGQTTILHILALMKETICQFPKSHIKKSCETILQLITLNYPIVTSCGLQVLHALFSSQTSIISAKLNAQIITALYEYQPASMDVQPTLAWLAVMQQAHVHLADTDIALSCMVLPKFIVTLTQLWLSERPEITSATTFTLEILLTDAVKPACDSPESVAQFKSKLMICFNAITAGLKYQYHKIWHQVLHVIGVMFDVGGANCSELLVDCLKSLAELRDSYKFSYNNELEHAIGSAIRSMGPEFVLNVVQLTTTTNNDNNNSMNLDRSWLLPVLKENIKSASLDYFVNNILPLAVYCQRRSVQLAEINDGIGAHSSELLFMQLWNLLPCFCNCPTDIQTSFKSLAKILGTAISTRKELRLPVMASLRKLITNARERGASDDLAELARFDKNYLPILFNVYTTKPIGSDEEGQRLAALETIKVYLAISRSELTEELLNNSITRLNSSSDDPEDSFIKESILDLIRALVPYQSIDNIKLLYDQCVKSLPDIKNNKEQKKAYRLLEEICGSSSLNCRKFVQNNRKDVQSLLMRSLHTAAVSSKGARLRCLNYLIKAQPHLDHESKLIRSIIPEVILACKDINEKTRLIAYELLNTICDLLLNHNQLQEFVTMIIAGLAGNPQLISCTVLGLASILHHFSGTLGQENIRLILDNICILMTSSTREIVASCLSFIKVYSTALPSPMVAASLPLIIKSLSSMTEDCKRHCRLKIRDLLDRLVRKYGCDYIIPHVSVQDTVMLKRLRNLRKLNARKKRQKDLTNRNDNDDDDDDNYYGGSDAGGILDDEEFIIKAKPKSVEEILADSDSDFDDDDNKSDSRQSINKSKKKNNQRQHQAWIEEDPDSIVDFTDPNVVSKITATKPSGSEASTNAFSSKTGADKKKDRGFKTAPDGRLIIADDDDNSEDDSVSGRIKLKKLRVQSDDSDSDDKQSVAETLVLSDRKRKRSGSSVKSGFSSTSQPPPAKYKAGGIGIHRPISGAASVRSATSGGSFGGSTLKKMKKQQGGKYDPYTYLPLQRSTLNKRKKAKAAGQYKSIVKAAKSGAAKGAKAKRNNKRK